MSPSSKITYERLFKIMKFNKFLGINENRKIVCFYVATRKVRTCHTLSNVQKGDVFIKKGNKYVCIKDEELFPFSSFQNNQTYRQKIKASNEWHNAQAHSDSLDDMTHYFNTGNSVFYKGANIYKEINHTELKERINNKEYVQIVQVSGARHVNKVIKELKNSVSNDIVFPTSLKFFLIKSPRIILTGSKIYQVPSNSWILHNEFMHIHGDWHLNTFYKKMLVVPTIYNNFLNLVSRSSMSEI
jgi:hypothetical protein